MVLLKTVTGKLQIASQRRKTNEQSRSITQKEKKSTGGGVSGGRHYFTDCHHCDMCPADCTEDNGISALHCCQRQYGTGGSHRKPGIYQICGTGRH